MYSCKMLILQKEEEEKNSAPHYFSLYITAEREKKCIFYVKDHFFF